MNFIKIARDIGFEDACKVNIASLRPRKEVRGMCSADKCHIYGKSWTCPPACGSIEYWEKRLLSYTDGVLVQTVGELDDEFDTVGIAAANRAHIRRFSTLARQMRLIEKDCLPLSAGTCTRCAACTYPDRPCRFPGKAFSSMEACGLIVSEVCAQSGMPYYRGEKKITFTSCILFNKKDGSI